MIKNSFEIFYYNSFIFLLFCLLYIFISYSLIKKYSIKITYFMKYPISKLKIFSILNYIFLILHFEKRLLEILIYVLLFLKNL